MSYNRDNKRLTTVYEVRTGGVDPPLLCGGLIVRIRIVALFADDYPYGLETRMVTSKIGNISLGTGKLTSGALAIKVSWYYLGFSPGFAEFILFLSV